MTIEMEGKMKLIIRLQSIGGIQLFFFTATNMSVGAFWWCYRPAVTHRICSQVETQLILDAAMNYIIPPFGNAIINRYFHFRFRSSAIPSSPCLLYLCVQIFDRKGRTKRTSSHSARHKEAAKENRGDDVMLWSMGEFPTATSSKEERAEQSRKKKKKESE